MRRVSVLTILVFCIAVLTPVTASAASSRVTGHPQPSATVVKSGVHLFGPSSAYKQTTKAKPSDFGKPPISGGDLTYYGGPVETNPVVYVIFWGASWGTSSSPSTDATILTNFWNEIGHTEHQDLMSQYYSQFGVPTTFISNTLKYAGTWFDSSVPPSVDSSCSSNSTIEDSTIQNEVATALDIDEFPKDTSNATYFVYTPSGYSVNDGGGDCSGSQFCAYHSNSDPLGPGDGFAYAAMPYPVSPSGSGLPNCLSGSWSVPNGDANADALANFSNHEWFESVTDPDPNVYCYSTITYQYEGCSGYTGWAYFSGTYPGVLTFDEVADECSYVFPSNTGSGGIDPEGNTLVNNGQLYYLQMIYSNATHLCETYTIPRTTGVYYPPTSTFYLHNHNAGGNADIAFNFGFAGAVPLFGDWTDQGYETVGVYNPSNGTFYLKYTNSGGNANIAFSFGPPNSIPLVGDWTGKGYDSIGVYYPPTGTFYLRNTNTGGNADIAFNYGPAHAKPVVGDWNGDGVDTIGVDVNGTFYLSNTNSGGNATIAFSFGPSGATPLAGDWVGQASSGIGIYTPSNASFYLRDELSSGNADNQFGYGPLNSEPVAGVFASVGGGPLLP